MENNNQQENNTEEIIQNVNEELTKINHRECIEGKKAKNKKKIFTRKMWSKEESSAVISYFNSYVKTNRSAPGKKMCLECLDKNKSTLNQRTWKDIKYFVHNYMKKINKKSC